VPPCQSGAFDQYDLGVAKPNDLNRRHPGDSHTVARLDTHAADVEAPRRRHQISVPYRVERQSDPLPALIVAPITLASARMRSASSSSSNPLASVTKRPDRSPLGNGFAPQDGLPPLSVGSIQIWNRRVVSSSRLYSECRTPEPADITCTSPASVRPGIAHRILMGDRALADIGDDLHVGMRMRREAGPRGDLVVVPDPQIAPAHPGRVVIPSEREMMLRLQPTVVGATEFAELPAFDHDELSCFHIRAFASLVTPKMGLDGSNENRKDGKSSFPFEGLPCPSLTSKPGRSSPKSPTPDPSPPPPPTLASPGPPSRRPWQRLESRLGERLIHRTSRRFALTEAGRVLAVRAARILAEGEAAEAEAKASSAVPRGRVRLAAPMSFGLRHVAPALPEFLAAHPEVSIDLQLDDRRVDLIAGGIDVALRIADLADSSLIARRLCPVRRWVVGSPAYFTRRGTPRRPRDLGDHACLGYAWLASARPGISPDAAGAAESVTVKGPLSANNGDALIGALEAGVGIALQPDFLAYEDA
jgi:DNA-binding transcriptional LysR family regulator